MRAYERLVADDGYEVLLFPLEYMYMSQDEGGDYSHQGTLSMDFLGWGANGRVYQCDYYAPCTCTLILKNYNGGNITYSNGLGGPFVPTTIKLIGDNYITANDSYGLGVYSTGVNFIGDGTLTISSKLAIIGFDSNSQNRNPVLADTVNTIKITAGNAKEENTEEVIEDTTDDDTNVEVVTDEDKHDWELVLVMFFCSGLIIAALLFIILILLVKNNKK